MKFLLSLLLAVFLFPVSASALQPGDSLVIINKYSNKLAYIKDNKVQQVYPAGTGKSDDLTPEGLFTVKVKAVNPYYRKKDIPGGDPRNPLGTRWIGFDAKGTDGRIYGIHGTNDPSSVGKHISHGCVRLLKENIETLYELVPLGAKVLIIKSSKDFQSIGRQYGAIQ
ncbi:L,D-transpeptidase [Peribacillus sp. B-H-3]|uniref:L,D-transpeptidase n=1 Tax=Peribacillus sp. B-H-3 TaxID=3400420 RepID=UPI003B025188